MPEKIEEIKQFKTLEDLREIIKEIEGGLYRPTRRLSHPTLYRQRDVAEGDKLVMGLQKKDWIFSSDEKWILPSKEAGLSFSSHWQHLKGVYKMKEKHNPGAAVNVYWVLNKADIPTDMEFLPDPSKKGHYFLTVKTKMTVYQLISKLKWLADKMSVIKDAGKAL